MRILVDEDLPRAIADLLRNLGIQAEHVIDKGLSGRSDKVILQAAFDADAVLITADLDFASVLDYPLGSHKGIIVLRFPDYYRRDQILSLVNSFLDAADLDSLIGTLVIVEPGNYRIRR